MPQRLTLENFINRSNIVHNNEYDYSNVVYINNNKKVKIICKKHGAFEMRPADHLNGQGCPRCKSEKLSFLFSLGKKTFVEKAKKIHGDKYDYSKVEYTNNRTKVCIICPEHGEFWQTPDKHLQGNGCPKCCKKNRKYTTDEFIEKAKEIHGEKYDYSKVKYGKNDKEKVCIICPEHGEFWQTPVNHLNGQGCKYCKKGKVFNTIDFIEAAKKIHGSKYDYSKTNYKKSLKKVVIICPEHGEFLQNPAKHLMGNGCPICSKKYHKGELFLLEELKRGLNGEEIIHSFRDKNILGRQELDIYLPKYKIGIEYQGEQHFAAVDFGGYGKDVAEQLFKENERRDREKFKKCKDSGIKIFYFSLTNKEDFIGEKMYTNVDELLAAINNVIKKEDEKNG